MDEGMPQREVGGRGVQNVGHGCLGSQLASLVAMAVSDQSRKPTTRTARSPNEGRSADRALLILGGARCALQ